MGLVTIWWLMRYLTLHIQSHHCKTIKTKRTKSFPLEDLPNVSGCWSSDFQHWFPKSSLAGSLHCIGLHLHYLYLSLCANTISMMPMFSLWHYLTFPFDFKAFAPCLLCIPVYLLQYSYAGNCLALSVMCSMYRCPKVHSTLQSAPRANCTIHYGTSCITGP